MRGTTLFFVTLVLAGALGGCLGSPETNGPEETHGARVIELRLVDAYSGAPLPLAQAVALTEGVPVLIASTSGNGTVVLHLPADVDELVLERPGYVMERLSPAPGTDTTVAMAPGVTMGIGPDLPLLRFREPLDLGSQTYPIAVGTACLELEDQPNQDCGLGEPSVEVDAHGTIYLSAVCCIGGAPPVLASRDDGASFQHLETPAGVREAFGIEGDFAIDQDGVIYFVDIELAATFQTTAWDKDGNFLHHTKWPAPPLVDRPWVRAEGSGALYYVYNTGSSTNIYTSQDGGRTWSPAPVHTAPFALGNTAKGIHEGELWVVGGSSGGYRTAAYTMDGGATWQSEQTTALAGGTQSHSASYFDEAGNYYVSGGADDTITVAMRDTNGTWHDAVQVSPEGGHHRYPWIAAGGEGKVAVAWYGTMDDIGGDALWYLFTAVSLDAHQENAHWAVAIADPEPVLQGNLQRQLLDFLQVEIGPNDAIHVGYSKVRHDVSEHEQLHYIQSMRGLPLSPETYFWGPR